jgi:HlyD family secretion protein
MEPTNKPRLKPAAERRRTWFRFGKKAQTEIEYLPDADEIERSPVPPLAQATVKIMALAFASACAWSALAKVDLIVTAHGHLLNPTQNVVVQPMETATVKTVDVKLGQVVKAGDTLATLDPTFVGADRNQLQQKLVSLETQLAGLEDEISSAAARARKPGGTDSDLQAALMNERRANYLAQQNRLTEGIAKNQAALSTNLQDQKLIRSRLDSIKEIESMQEKMVAQKFGAPLQYLEAKQRAQQVEQELQVAQSREQEIRSELAAVKSEKMAFERSWRQKTMEEMLSLSRERDSTREQLQKADRRQTLINITSPIDGVVLEIAKLSPGSVVREAETFFTLVPLGTTLEAEVQIDSADIGYIKLNDDVHLKVDSFPFQRHGMLEGKVRTISQDAFKRDGSLSKTAQSEAYYNSRLTLTQTELKNMNENARLLPGMTLSAEIVVGKRSVLSYIVWPLTKGLNEAIREP